VEAGQTTENKADPANIGIRAASFIDLHRKRGRANLPRRITALQRDIDVLGAGSFGGCSTALGVLAEVFLAMYSP